MKKIVLVLLTAAMLATTPAMALAKEADVITDTTLTPAVVEDLISAIDEDYPEEEDVRAAKEAYDGLTMAQKVNVKNYAVLRRAEQTLAERDNATPTESKKRGTRYSFRISEYLPKATITVKYLTDTDGDGVMEEPSLKLSSPTGKQIDLPNNETSVKSSWYDFSIDRTKSGATINVLMAESGTWTVEADNEVFFELSDYTEQPSYEEISKATKDAKEDVSKPAEEKSEPMEFKTILAIIMIPICIVALIFFFIMNRRADAMSKPGAEKKEAQKKKKEQEKEDPADDADDVERQKAEADVLQSLLQGYERSREEEAAKYAGQQEGDAPVVEDSRLTETVLAEEFEEDDGITPLSGGPEPGGRFK